MKTELIKDVAKLMAKSYTVQKMAVRSVEGWEEFLTILNEEQLHNFKTVLEEEAKSMLAIDHEFERKDKQGTARYERALERIIFNAQQS